MDTAIKISPNYAGGHYGLGVARYQGALEPEKAIDHCTFALRLNPFNPMSWAAHEKLSCAYRFTGDFELAIVHGLKACNGASAVYRPHLVLAAALAAAGSQADARASLARAKALRPDLSLVSIPDVLAHMHPAIIEDFQTHLARAESDE